MSDNDGTTSHGRHDWDGLVEINLGTADRDRRHVDPGGGATGLHGLSLVTIASGDRLRLDDHPGWQGVFLFQPGSLSKPLLFRHDSLAGLARWRHPHQTGGRTGRDEDPASRAGHGEVSSGGNASSSRQNDSDALRNRGWCYQHTCVAVHSAGAGPGLVGPRHPGPVSEEKG